MDYNKIRKKTKPVILGGNGIRRCVIGLSLIHIQMCIRDSPKVDSSAKRLASISHMYLLENQLTVIDSTATSLAKDNNMPIMIFGLDDPDNIFRAVSGEEMGTVVNG